MTVTVLTNAMVNKSTFGILLISRKEDQEKVCLHTRSMTPTNAAMGIRPSLCSEEFSGADWLISTQGQAVAPPRPSLQLIPRP